MNFLAYLRSPRVAQVSRFHHRRRSDAGAGHRCERRGFRCNGWSAPAYSVSKRIKELGIRVALGAQRSEVLQTALGRAVKLLAWGSAAGLLLGILASRVLASIVYSATPRDLLVLAGVVAAMLLLGLLATWIPAQRALSLDPVTLLREE
jgi:ABC-type lipoprotein release transport system permease subunit